jgi:hypothetical protein
MAERDHLGPTIRIEVEGIELEADITKWVQRCVVEQTQEMADKITLTVLNPQEDVFGSGLTGFYAFTDSKVFQPGNTVLVYMGYASDEKLVGAGVIQRYMPSFPQDGPAMLTIVAYDGSVLLMDGESAREGRVWEDTAHSDVILSVANSYAFYTAIQTTEGFTQVAGGVIDPSGSGNWLVPSPSGDGSFDSVPPRYGTERQTTKKRGMTDWELVNGLARLHSYETKVRWDETLGGWRLYWGPAIFEQEKQYTFTYSVDGPSNTLLSFTPEMAIKGQPSTVKVLYFDYDTRTWEEIALEEDEAGESVKFTGSGELENEIRSSTAYRISSGGVSVEVVPAAQFESAEDAQLFAERFFRARKNQFIMGRGKIVGLEVLKVGGIHILDGLGVQLSGEYQFTTVRHVFGARDGYTCEFFANKVVK